ncbi:hypothetical protein CFN78_11915 [Amycolatopsis antarctica]|uniref:Uncharacterized protein n=1 Tax=Amycolatopsis antarctica TaxID=1854586 RepID=A0A263D3B5_9PSEU|nr:bacteriophage holin [Amycolatopsis antarctica]OZM72953.1 hypothetical protein CFN78_11915 [Amycolatopsis antarctica]
MLYLPSVVLAVVGLVVLIILVVRIVRLLRRFSRTASMVTRDTGDRAGLLRARSAALRVALDGRRRRQAT